MPLRPFIFHRVDVAAFAAVGRVHLVGALRW